MPRPRPFDLSIVTRRQIATFVRNVDRSGDCWLWTASGLPKGYGFFSIGSVPKGTRRRVLTHRLAWVLAHPKRALKPDDCVLHTCDNPPCCRTDHLFLGTQLDNIRDMARKGRRPCGEDNHNAKLTEADVLEIRASKELQRVLAARFRVDQAYISLVKLRKRWRHVA